MKRTIATHRLAVGLAAVLLSSTPQFFRRDRDKIKTGRAEAYRDLFAALALLYESAARLRSEWRDRWRDRRDGDLPPKYDFGNEIAKEAAYDVRYAVNLLQRYRWKSVVQPLFDEIDEPSWSRFSAAASELSPALLAIADQHHSFLRDDEIDWINVAVEQLDEATRRRRHATASDLPRSRQIAEGTYQPLFIAIHLSDRLIERQRFEATDRQ